MAGFEIVGFATMAEVVAHLKAGKPLFYKVPLSYRSVRIDGYARPFGKVRVYIRAHRLDPESDPFVADEGHLDRFRKIQ